MSLEDVLASAIADPGTYTKRGNNYAESIPRWGARAVPLALSADGKVIADRQLLTDVLNYLGERSTETGYIWDALQKVLDDDAEASRA